MIAATIMGVLTPKFNNISVRPGKKIPVFPLTFLEKNKVGKTFYLFVFNFTHRYVIQDKDMSLSRIDNKNFRVGHLLGEHFSISVHLEFGLICGGLNIK